MDRHPQDLTPLVRIAAQRLLTADQVAASKWLSGAPIEDPDREQQVLEAMDAEAVRLGIDRATVQRVFRDQIEANKYVQHALHDRWRAHPAEAPTTAPDLGVVREEINRLNAALLLAIRDAGPLLTEPRCAPYRKHAREAVARELRLDQVHSEALQRALTDLCTARPQATDPGRDLPDAMAQVIAADTEDR
ncbi:chorismate mutase [Streptomyces sp. WZ-12]|uniref:chorismate mutase n=1 Tax=Streptomyces sp. WZ-12 TaxID=3030210 RepID=UPI002380D64D|nr:chorismate mutase [Streptomyces sp. WZ-12]